MTNQFVPDVRERRPWWRTLQRALRPVDRRFFPLLSSQAALALEGLQTLTQLLADASDPDRRVRAIETLEKRADMVVDQVRAALRRSFFPPFARGSLHELSNRLDDVLDITEDAAQCLHLYHITAVTHEAQRLAELAVEAMQHLCAAVGQLPDLSAPRAVLALCAEVDDLEAQADHVLRAAMSRLFREEPDARQIIKLKAIYEVLESLTDKCKDIANEIEAIVLRHG